jgi:hypothetical protein
MICGVLRSAMGRIGVVLRCTSGYSPILLNVCNLLHAKCTSGRERVTSNSITQLRSEEWWGTRHVAGSDAMPASTEMRADAAQYDKPLRGALLRTEGRPAVGIRTADEEIIPGGGQARRPEHDPWVVPGIAASFRISGYFSAVSLKRAFSYIAASDWHRKPATAPAGWPASATFRSPSAQGRTKGVRRRRAVSDEGNAAR